MAINGVIQYLTTAASNTDVAGVSIAENCPVANLNNSQREIMADIVERLGNSVSVASAATVALGDQEEQYVTISGTTGITSFGTPGVANKFGYWVKFDGALTLAHNATSLILPGGANITTAAGDCAFFQHEGSGNWRCLSYVLASGQPIAVVTSFAPAAVSGRTEITSVDTSNDFVPIWDATDSLIKKVKPSNLAASSKFVNRYYSTEYTTSADITTVLPADDSTPVNTEGVQILSVSVTTTTATQRVRLSVSGQASHSGGLTICAAIFRDSTCIQAKAVKALGDTGTGVNLVPIDMQKEDAPGAAATYTYTVRVGPGASGTVRMNGTSSARYFGGTSGATLIADLIEP